MIMKKAYIIFTALLLWSFFLTATAQDVTQLQDRINSSEREIQKLEAQIRDNNKKLTGSTANLKLVQKKINARTAIIRDLDAQTKLLGGQIKGNDRDISRRDDELGRLQDAYSRVMRANYMMYRSNGYWGALLNSDGVVDLVRRVYYMNLYNKRTRQMLTDIRQQKTELSNKKQELSERQKKLLEIQQNRAKELQTLNREQQELTALSKKLKGSDAHLKARAQKYRKQIDDMQRQIARIVEQEARAAAKDAASRGQKASGGIGSGPFAAQKGRMNSPLQGGTVIDRFGIHNHPTQKDVKVNNKGINISGAAGSTVRAVFRGEVRRVFLVPGMGSSVILRHEGGFLSVYSNLATTSVATGQMIETGGTIGVLGAINGQDPMLHFEIWFETDNLDPSPWIGNR